MNWMGMTVIQGMDIPIMHISDQSSLVRDVGSTNFSVNRLMSGKHVGELFAVKCIERGEKVIISKNTLRCLSSLKSSMYVQTKSQGIVCARHTAAGGRESGDHRKIKLSQMLNRVYKAWDTFPYPIKTFPWNRALDNFVQLILDLILAVVKLLSIPLLAITSLSEMSYCAHEKKLYLLPLPLLTGIALAGVFKETALEVSPLLKEADVPWHLIGIGMIFTLIKLPGPYYPYWGRVLIPHLANGGLIRTLWFAFQWYGRSPKAPHNENASSDE